MLRGNRTRSQSKSLWLYSVPLFYCHHPNRIFTSLIRHIRTGITITPADMFVNGITSTLQLAVPITITVIHKTTARFFYRCTEYCTCQGMSPTCAALGATIRDDPVLYIAHPITFMIMIL